jgi:hypothetical protein
VFQSVSTCPVPPGKNISLRVLPKSNLDLRRPASYRGAFRDRHERRARDAMDAGCASDEGASRGRRSRGVLIPRRWYQVCGEFRRRRRQQARLSGETTKETVKTIRAGSAGSFRRTCGVLTRVVFSPPREAAGVHVAPGIPCALFIGGSRGLQAPGVFRVAGRRSRVLNRSVIPGWSEEPA